MTLHITQIHKVRNYIQVVTAVPFSQKQKIFELRISEVSVHFYCKQGKNNK